MSHRSLLDRWGRLVAHHRGLVLLTWVAIIAFLAVLAFRIGGEFGGNFSVPGTESQAAQDLLESRFPQQAGARADVVFRFDGSFTDPAVQDRIRATLDGIAALPGIVAVETPFDHPTYVSPVAPIARAVVIFEKEAGAIESKDVRPLLDFVDNANAPGFRVEAGGQAVRVVELPHFGTAEFYGLAAAAVVLVVAFGSVVAAGLPIGAAIFGLAPGFALLLIAARSGQFPEFSPQFAAMIGIGVGIDYSLLVITRFREGLHSGLAVDEAVGRAVATAGRSVIFAGAVVALSFLGLLVMGLPFVGAIGITGTVMVTIAVLVALSVTPAVMAFLGRRVDALAIPYFYGSEGVNPQSVWYRFSRFIQRHPWPAFFLALAFLLVLATPVLDMRLGFTDAGNKTTAYHTRRAYDLLAQGFGPGFNGPLIAVIDGPGAATAANPLRERIASLPGVAAVGEPVARPDGETAILTVIPTHAPQDEATEELIGRLRHDVLRPFAEESGLTALLTGPTAAFVDIGHRISARMPYLFVGVIGISFLLLMTVFRSVVIAAKAAILNLLSIGAAFGVVVAVFQWGFLADLVGIKEGPIETFLPMILFAILFGLSMDYEVFLISRIREEYVRTGANGVAVANGLAATARVISSAAAIMIVVFLSFVTLPDRTIKEFGVGLAVAVLVDATVVRLVLVPAAMELLGRANWWFPRWLDRILPRVDVDIAETAAMTPAGGR